MKLTINQALQQGIEAHKEGKLQEAERMYRSIIQSQPLHPDANHNLGVLAVSMNKVDAALPLLKTALEANTKIEQFWLSYIDALIRDKQFDNVKQVLEKAKKQGLDAGRLNSLEAQISSKTQKTHTSRSSPLKELLDSLLEHYQNERFSDAEKLASEITQDFPKNQFAWKVLGAVLRATGRNSESLNANQTSVALSPQDAGAHNNLGNTFQGIGRLDEAEASYIQAIGLKPDYLEALHNLSIVRSYMNNFEAEIISLQNVMRIDTGNYGLTAGVNLALCNFLEGDFEYSKKHLLATAKIQEKISPETKNERVYWNYLSKILKWHENHNLANKKEKNDKNLYVLGESHSLISHHLRIQNSKINFFCSARLIKGCKQWHLGNAYRNQYKKQFESIFCALPKNSYILLAIGEIDCRLETGIIVYKKKFPEKKTKEIIRTTVENYLTYIQNNNFDCHHKVIIQGVPCPNIDITNHSQNDIKQLVKVIKIFNYELKMQSKEKGFGFLDTHQLTDKGDGLSNGLWHIDDYHLSIEGFQEAWRGYFSD